MPKKLWYADELISVLYNTYVCIHDFWQKINSVEYLSIRSRPANSVLVSVLLPTVVSRIHFCYGCAGRSHEPFIRRKRKKVSFSRFFLSICFSDPPFFNDFFYDIPERTFMTFVLLPTQSIIIQIHSTHLFVVGSACEIKTTTTVTKYIMRTGWNISLT